MIPLEGLDDYVDITAIINPWQALVVCVFFLAVIVWPGVQSILTNKKVKEVQKTLTTNNGGSTVKDQNDRIEKKLDDHLEWSENFVRNVDERLLVIEREHRKRWPWTR